MFCIFFGWKKFFLEGCPNLVPTWLCLGGPALADVVISALKTNIGDGRQRAEKRMGNKNKNNTLKPWKRPTKFHLLNVPHDFVNKTSVILFFGEQCSERRHLRHFPGEWMTDRRGPWADRLDSWSIRIEFNCENQAEDLTRPGPKARRIYEI